MPRINFKCPKCGEDLLTEIQEAITSYEVTFIERIDNVTTTLDYGPLLGAYNGNGDVSYECSACFYKIATNERDLYDWLETNGMLEDINEC
jgi:hypothetical protein